MQRLCLEQFKFVSSSLRSLTLLFVTLFVGHVCQTHAHTLPYTLPCNTITIMLYQSYTNPSISFNSPEYVESFLQIHANQFFFNERQLGGDFMLRRNNNNMCGYILADIDTFVDLFLLHSYYSNFLITGMMMASRFDGKIYSL